jgi:hypothetical protein
MNQPTLKYNWGQHGIKNGIKLFDIAPMNFKMNKALNVGQLALYC